MNETPLEYEISLEVQKIIVLVRNNIIPFIPRGIDQFVDHGIEHIQEVLYKKQKLMCWCVTNGITFNNIEKILMDASIWCHDIGCLICREDHGNRSAEIINFIDTRLDEEIFDCLKLIISHHTNKSKDELNKLSILYYRDHEIKSDLIVALLRLSDALDAGCRSKHLREYGNRAPPIVFNILNKYGKLKGDSILHWKAHGICEGVIFDSDENIIYITYERDDNGDNEKIVEEVIKKSIDEEIDNISDIFKKYDLPQLKTEISSRMET